MKFDLETFNKFDFTGSQITTSNIYVGQFEKTLSDFNLEGSFEKKQYEQCKFWSLRFNQFENPSDVTIADFTGKKIRFIDICPDGELFLVKMIVETNGDAKEIAFRCREISPHYYRYRGMSYRNLYGTEEYQKAIDGQRFVTSKQSQKNGKVTHFETNPKASVCYFLDGDSVTLIGNVEFVEDREIQAYVWNESDRRFFKNGIDDSKFRY